MKEIFLSGDRRSRDGSNFPKVMNEIRERLKVNGDESDETWKSFLDFCEAVYATGWTDGQVACVVKGESINNSWAETLGGATWEEVRKGLEEIPVPAPEFLMFKDLKDNPKAYDKFNGPTISDDDIDDLLKDL